MRPLPVAWVTNREFVFATSFARALLLFFLLLLPSNPPFWSQKHAISSSSSFCRGILVCIYTVSYVRDGHQRAPVWRLPNDVWENRQGRSFKVDYARGLSRGASLGQLDLWLRNVLVIRGFFVVRWCEVIERTAWICTGKNGWISRWTALRYRIEMFVLRFEKLDHVKCDYIIVCINTDKIKFKHFCIHSNKVISFISGKITYNSLILLHT